MAKKCYFKAGFTSNAEAHLNTKNLATIVVAAGHGCIRPGHTKLLEPVDSQGTPMIVRVMRTAMCAVSGPIVLVLNHRFADQILEAISEHGAEDKRLCVVYQEERRGAADAVRNAVERVLVRKEARNFLVVYGDMPLWRSETMERLAQAHLESKSLMSMVSVTIEGADSPRVLERYGRILRDAEGRIVNVVEPGDAVDNDVLATRRVNPSLYVFNTEWFQTAVCRVPPKSRPDGYGDEVHLPPLARLLAEDGGVALEVPLQDATEALGVNTAEELAMVSQIIEDDLKARRLEWIRERDEIARDHGAGSADESNRYAANAHAEWVLEELGRPFPQS